jgi:hypothetical protein
MKIQQILLSGYRRSDGFIIMTSTQEIPFVFPYSYMAIFADGFRTVKETGKRVKEKQLLWVRAI